MQMERIEAAAATSGARITDPELDSYVSGLACRVAGDYCDDVRVYVLGVPAFNASMYPNGMLNVLSGLILRCENEAQLATVLSHEISHYVKRHSLKRFKDMSARVDLLSLLGLATAASGVPGRSAPTITARVEKANRVHW